MTDDRTDKSRTETSKEAGDKTWYEEFTVTGTELLTKVKDLVAEGNVRKLYIKDPSGRTLLEIPLTVGVAVTVVTAALAPVLVAVGAIAAMLTKVTIGVERTAAPEAPAQEATDQGPQDPQA